MLIAKLNRLFWATIMQSTENSKQFHHRAHSLQDHTDTFSKTKLTKSSQQTTSRPLGLWPAIWGEQQ